MDLDESASICETCPHDYENNGRPIRTLFPSSLTSIFSCKHKVTKRPICAVPCNGVRTCEDGLDEECQGPGLIMTLVTSFVLSMSFILASSCLSYHRLKKGQTEITGFELKPVETIKNIRPSGDQSQSYGTNLYLNLSICKNNMEVSNAFEVAANYYSQVCQGTCYENDYLIMILLGTNDLSAYFYDCVDKSLTVKVHTWVYAKFSTLVKLKKMCFGVIIILLRGTLSLCLRYSDISKDILFLYMIWLQLGQYENGSFPKAVFYILAASLLVTEISSASVILFTDFSGPWWRKACVILLAPLMPAYYIYDILHCELSKFITLNYCSDNNEVPQEEEINIKQVYELDLQIWSLRLKMAKLQYVENVLENIPQLTILIIISLLDLTSSGIVVNLQSIFMDDRVFIGWVLAAISAASIIRGQVNFLVASKNGCQTGIVLLIMYFLLGVSSRYPIYC